MNQFKYFVHYENPSSHDTFADQMEYLSIHELCEVQPRLPKGTTLKELGLG